MKIPLPAVAYVVMMPLTLLVRPVILCLMCKNRNRRGEKDQILKKAGFFKAPSLILILDTHVTWTL